MKNMTVTSSAMTVKIYEFASLFLFFDIYFPILAYRQLLQIPIWRKSIGITFRIKFIWKHSLILPFAAIHSNGTLWLDKQLSTISRHKTSSDAWWNNIPDVNLCHLFCWLTECFCFHIPFCLIYLKVRKVSSD